MPIELKVLLDVEVHRVPTRHGARTLVADLWLPQGARRPMPAVVYIHGGGWRAGTQYRPPFQPRMFDEGFAIMATTYRFSGEAPFPAMLHDCKTMVRWLRAHAADFGIDAERIGAWGISAGGHLVCMLGVTNGLPEWEGDGPWREHSSDVRCVVSWCGPTDLERVVTEDAFAGATMRELLIDVLDGPPQQRLAEARAASPVAHARAGNPPHLLVNGASDDIVPAVHATAFGMRAQQVGVDARVLVVPEQGHALEGPQVWEPTRQFFLQHLGSGAPRPFSSP